MLVRPYCDRGHMQFSIELSYLSCMDDTVKIQRKLSHVWQWPITYIR